MSEKDPWLAEEAYQYMHRNTPGRGEPALESPTMLEKVWGRRWGECPAPCRPGTSSITI